MESATRAVLKGFVVFEGVDGAGTTTQLKRTEEALSRLGLPHWTSFEPTELPTGVLARRILRGEVEARPETLALVFAADRHEHLYGRAGILERLGRGEIVVLDRYLFSSLAYQGMTCVPDFPRGLNAHFPLPELLLYFDVAPALSMHRVETRAEREIFDELTIQERVRAAYEDTLSEFSDSPMRIVRIDASKPLEEVGKEVDGALATVLVGRHT